MGAVGVARAAGTGTFVRLIALTFTVGVVDAFAFDTFGVFTTNQAGNIVVFAGTARIDPQAPPAHQVAAYAQKYGWGFERNGWTAQQFAELYSIPILVTPTSLRGY